MSSRRTRYGSGPSAARRAAASIGNTIPASRHAPAIDTAENGSLDIYGVPAAVNAEPPSETTANPAPQSPMPAPAKRWRDLRSPAIALVLGVAPFWLFFGFHQRATVNGRVVQDSGLNILGLILAIAGIVMVFRMLRDDGSYGHPPRWLPRTVLGLVAGLVCLFQVGQTLGLYRFDPSAQFRDLRVRLLGHPEPAAAAYAGLDAALREGLGRRGQATDEGRLRDDVVTTVARLRAEIVQYNHIASHCGDDYRRFGPVDLPSFLTAEDRAYVDQAESSTRERWRTASCTARERQFMTGPLVDAVHRDRDVLARQATAYSARFGTTPPADAAPTRATEMTTDGLPVAIGATVGEVQAAFGVSAAPATDAEWNEPALAFPDRGVRVMFGPDGRAMRIVLDAPFAGTVTHVAIGDSLRSINRRIGGAAAGPRGLGEVIGLNSYGNGRLVFRSTLETGTVNRIILR